MNPMTLARDIAAVERWWATLPEDQRQRCYRPHALREATGATSQNLPAVLEMLGWRRARRHSRIRDREHYRVYYAPPGQTVPRPQRHGMNALAALFIYGFDPTDVLPR